ncbi:hypothetical protein [Agromyces sp. NBRC 114283]|uniref:hypothetical protein n=1 Tax=Agromyces sp. NBRC 114283 TaxID=2994521 RepID=UPI00249FB801|nr:hypothetical protein [Agromyces sp. NBRC 114283]GLU87778.1 hypothetical protein Agsp01_00330 [Agromyces sp. NBRC 114283]
MSNEADRWGIDELDGLTRTLIAHRIQDWDVMIGGGPDRFIVTATADQGTRVANALSGTPLDDNDDETVDLTIGGQAVDYPAEYAVTRSEAMLALSDLESGVLPDGRWEQLS